MTSYAPGVSNPTEPSSTGSTPSGPREPRLPAAAKAPDKAGAKAFVAYYIRLLNYASWTGDTRALQRHAPACSGCKSYADLYDTTYRHGGWFKHGEWIPIARSWLILSKQPGYLIDVKVNAAAGLQKLRRGGRVTRFLADTYQLDFHIDQTANAWIVTRLETPA